MSCCRRRFVALLCFAAILAGLFLGRGQFLPWAARWLDVGQPPRRGDYVIVLGGNVAVRAFVAASLIRLGLARQALVTHVASSPEVEQKILPPEHEVAIRILRHRGVPGGDILLLGRNNRSTYDEAVALAEFLASAPDARVLVVTNHYHTRRARWIFSQVLGEQMAQVAFVSAPTEEFQRDTWWQSDRGFSAIVGENLKFGFYLFRYSRLADAMAGIVFLALVAVLGRTRLRRGPPHTKID